MLRYRLHPAGLIALRISGSTVTLLSFSPFSFGKMLFRAGGRKKKQTKWFNKKKLNVMNIIGRLTGDAKINTTPNDKQVVNFSIAVNESYRNKKGERVEFTEYFNCAYWQSTNVARILTKGTLVELTGRISKSAWIGSDGEAHAAFNFHTSYIKPYGGGRRNEIAAESSSNNSTPSANNSKNNNRDKDDLPF